MNKKSKEVKNGSVWLPTDGATKGFVTVTRKEGNVLHYKHTDDRGRIHPSPYVAPEDAFLRRFKEI
jgi:hypothetical protein